MSDFDSRFIAPVRPLIACDAGTPFVLTPERSSASDVQALARRWGTTTGAIQTPWGVSGTLLTPGTSLEEMTREAGMDFTIGLRKSYYGPPLDVVAEGGDAEAPPVVRLVPQEVKLINERSGAWLSTMSQEYIPVQPSEIMRFYHELAQSHGVQLEAAGVMHEGRTLWAFARTGESFRVAMDDKSELFLLFVTACDGSMATRVYVTSLRFACFNVMPALNAEGGLLAKINHRRKIDVERLQGKFAGLPAAAAEHARRMNELAERRINWHDARNYFRELVAARDELGAVIESRALDRRVDRLMDSLNHGEGSYLPGSRYTLYGLVQAVTHDIDHGARRRSADTRMASILWGAGAKLKARALRAAEEMA